MQVIVRQSCCNTYFTMDKIPKLTQMLSNMIPKTFTRKYKLLNLQGLTASVATHEQSLVWSTEWRLFYA